MEDFIVVIAIVHVTAAVLQICLFFKLWGMANNVRQLRKKHAYTSNVDYEIGKLCIFGKNDAAKELAFEAYFEVYEDQNDFNNAHAAKKVLKERLKRIGEPMPEFFEKINVYGDVDKLYKAGYNIHSTDIPEITTPNLCTDQ